MSKQFLKLVQDNNLPEIISNLRNISDKNILNKALKIASKNGYFEIVKFLVENGANIHPEDDYSLRWASKNGYFEIVKF